MTIFASSLWHEWYTSPWIASLVGVSMPKALFVEQPKGIVSSFHEAGKEDAFFAGVEKLIVDKPNATEKVLREGVRLTREARERIDRYPKGNEDFEELVDFQVRLGQQTANIPRVTLHLHGQHELASPHIVALAEELRSQTIYPEFTAKVIVPFAATILKKAGVENPEQKVNLVTYKEIRNRNFEDSDRRIQQDKLGKFFVYEINSAEEGITFSDSNDEVLTQLMGFSPNTREVKGTVAYPGKVTGRVRVVLGDKARFERGDILVSINSSPRFMPFIVKSGAIVTDEGGLGCHAAIVSRELKKPCVIGTKIATKVLKDGDMVEVDAEKGIVRILT